METFFNLYQIVMHALLILALVVLFLKGARFVRPVSIVIPLTLALAGAVVHVYTGYPVPGAALSTLSVMALWFIVFKQRVAS
ncbi:hypothetical protein [Enterovibrio norvegicus]|uniref:hypothetical protein n=1 Tax=Enterovibrio norvegicus TaxID=188144 RepID=UPI00352E90BC